MLTGTLNKIREEKAERIRDIEYIRNISLDDYIDDRFFDIETSMVKESGNIYAESAEVIRQIPTDENFKKEEINRILNTDRKLSFDDIIGIDE
jgi:hypothetical protein